jgi:hypothetical protein
MNDVVAFVRVVNLSEMHSQIEPMLSTVTEYGMSELLHKDPQIPGVTV